MVPFLRNWAKYLLYLETSKSWPQKKKKRRRPYGIPKYFIIYTWLDALRIIPTLFRPCSRKTAYATK
jgi:hypothetical protein